MIMEKLSTVLIENQDRYEKGLLLPQIPPIKSVRVVKPIKLKVKAKKKVAASAGIIMKNGLNDVLNAYDHFFENQSDPESVHLVRVRIRKFRAILAFFRPLFKAENYLIQQDTLRRMGQQFSEVRQLDVLLDGLSEIEKNSAMEIIALAKVKAHLHSKRNEAFEHLLTALESDAFALDLLDIWVWKINDPWQAGAPFFQLSLTDYTTGQIDKWLKKIKKSMTNLDLKDQQAVHQVRIKSKKLRYVIEQLSDILDKGTRKSLDAFEKIQDDLGDYHDVFANQQLLEQLVSESADCQLYYEAGIIIGWQMMDGNRKMKKFIK